MENTNNVVNTSFVNCMRLLIPFLMTTILLCCGQVTKAQQDEFITVLNNYQADSLQKMIAKNFHIRRTYTTHTTDRKTFLGEYIQKSKAFNGKYIITKIISTGEPKILVAEDQSDYLKYLRVRSPLWKITISRNAEKKIEEVTFDTTETFRSYSLDIKAKEASFKKWLSAKYPAETLEQLHENDKLLFDRLRTYYNQQ
jgi:hypothetical protein